MDPVTTPLPVLCSQAAKDCGDDPAGTAATFSSFLLLRHPGPWSANAAEDATGLLPPGTAAAVAATSGLRAFAIRDVHPRRRSHPPAGYCGVNGPSGYVAPLREASDASVPPARREALVGPLFAVCTNGRRDRCCAIVGRGVAVGLHAEFGDRVVEISHLGGHRYAGTMLVLPWGYAYGFLDLAGARAVVRAADRGLVHPQGLRGRADLPPAAQAADVPLRRDLGPAAPDAVLIRAVPAGHGDRVSVDASVLGEPVTVRLRRESGPTVGETLCGGKLFATGRWIRDQLD